MVLHFEKMLPKAQKFARKISVAEFRYSETIILRFAVILFHSNLDEKITRNEQKVTRNEQKVTRNEQKITRNEQKVTSNEQKVTSNQQPAKSSASTYDNT